jgi:transcriptional regulator with XRE-family HTH domain
LHYSQKTPFFAHLNINLISLFYPFAMNHLDLGTKVARLRSQFGFSQKQLALKIRMKQQQLSAIERNQKHPNESTLKRIAEGIGVSVDDLKSLDTLIQHNSEQGGGNAANIIVQQNEGEVQTALEYAWKEVEFWRQKAIENEQWRERAMLAEARLSSLSNASHA